MALCKIPKEIEPLVINDLLKLSAWHSSCNINFNMYRTQTTSYKTNNLPRYREISTEDKFGVEIDLPGLEKKDIKVLEYDAYAVKLETCRRFKGDTEDEERTMILDLGAEFDFDSVSAVYSRGVLKITADPRKKKSVKVS